jgi:hypothetical protein
MAVTLAQAKLNVQDDLQLGVIDEFRKSSYLMDNLPFDDVVSPTGGGATLTYGYTRLVTQPTAAFRAVNEEYTPSEVQKQRYTVDLKIFGGTFEVDRIIAGMGGIADEVALQMAQKIKAATALFCDTVINGDSASNAKAFDGLDVALTGSDTEYNTTTAIDLSTSALVTTNYMAFLDELDEFLSELDGEPSALLGNAKMCAKLRAIARRAGMYQTTQDEWGRTVERYGNIPFVDLGTKPGSNDPIVPIANGETSLYAVRFGLDGFHGISMAGQPPVRSWLPDFSTAGAVKTGEVEMVAAVALKATKAAGVFRKIKVTGA